MFPDVFSKHFTARLSTLVCILENIHTDAMYEGAGNDM